MIRPSTPRALLQQATSQRGSVASRFRRSARDALLLIGLFGYGVAVTALVATGHLVVSQAGALLVGPIAFVIALLRPEWLLLGLLALPYQFLDSTSPKYLTYVLIWALVGFLLDQGISLSPRTGVYFLLGIIILAASHKAHVSPEASAFAASIWALLVYYAALMLLGFHTARSGRLHIDLVVNALLIGVIGSALLQPFIDTLGRAENSLFGAPWGGKFEYIAVIGFGVAYARSALKRAADIPQSGWDRRLTFLFFPLMLIGYGRAGWIAALIIAALVSLWTRRKLFWVAAAVVIVIGLTIPVFRERVLPTEGTGLSGNAALAKLTTGRWPLWVFLWDHSVNALPEGHGFGYEWSLTSAQVFHAQNQFGAGKLGFNGIFAHNDFLYLFSELGIFGAGLLLLQWGYLFVVTRRLSRRGLYDYAGYGARVLTPILIVMLCVQLFDNGFTIRVVAEHFYLLAGAICGLWEWSRLSAPAVAEPSYDVT